MNARPRPPRTDGAPLGRFGPLARVALLSLLALLVACSPAEPTEHAGHGIAVDVDREARTITLEHGDIPGLMQAMTMTFPVAPEVDLGTVEPGSTVDFEVRSEGNTITVTAIEKATPDGP